MANPFFHLPMRSLLVGTVLLVLSLGCVRVRDEPLQTLTTVVLQDRNGFSETISQPDRLDRLRTQDFTSNQPYQKVIRVYERQPDGSIPSVLTTYYSNGQLHHLLEVVSGRAYGCYQQYYPNGVLRMEAFVVGGVADLTEEAIATWKFDGEARVWTDNGSLLSVIPYRQGELNGLEILYHPSGEPRRETPYRRNQIHGVVRERNAMGLITLESAYVEGRPHGLFTQRSDHGVALAEERWQEGLLIEGSYHLPLPQLPGDEQLSVKGGAGWRPAREEQGSWKISQVQGGALEGRVLIVNEMGRLLKCWQERGGQKEGVEEFFDVNAGTPRLQVTWSEGSLNGPARSYYPSGELESSWEMVNNQRHGKMISRYPKGEVMLMEEYEHEKLMKGEYYGLGDPMPMSRVTQGNGTATLFQPDGRTLRSILVRDGHPVVE
jgi:antitoxin component YwqK of YwqJK toxin-antitoxin module